MRVLFLGTGGYHPNARRHTACVMIPEAGLVFDAGSSFFRVAGNLETDELDVFLSHAHLDHVCGLTYFLKPLFLGDVKAFRVHSTEATIAAIEEHVFAEPLFPVKPEFDYRPIKADEPVALANGIRVLHRTLEHPGGSTGFRVEFGDKSLAYITDTTADDSYVEFIRGVDLLIHECYFGDEMADWAAKTGHSHTTPVAEVARRAEVGRLVLVHIDPYRPDDDPIGIETARAIFPETIIAEDSMSIDL